MYSENKELRYGSREHMRILNALRERIQASAKRMEEFDEKFVRAEEQQTSYIHEKDVDAARRQKWDNDGEVDYTTLYVPFDYATVLAAHTYWASVFLGRTPVLEYTGLHGEGEHQVSSVNALMEYQFQRGSWLAPMYIWLYDASSYPFGVIGNYWCEEWHNSSVIEEVPIEIAPGIPLEGKTRKVKTTRQIRGYKGNKLFNVMPQDFLPDHRVSIVRCQEGEYCGRRVEIGWNSLVKGRSTKVYYNLDVVKDRAKKNAEEAGWWESTVPDKELPREGDYADVSTSEIPDVGIVKCVEIYVELIPKDWELGQSDAPEMWRFTVASDCVIIESRPCGNLHGRFPFFALPYDYDGHSFIGRSLYDVMRPLSRTLTWLLNSHMYNVRAVLNNKLLVDPSRIVMKDLTARDNRAIRLQPRAYGSDPRTAVHQLAVGDVTQQHLRDMQVIMDMIQRATGVNDNIMGMMNTGGRKTATEIRGSSTMGINRLKTTAEWWSAIGFGPLAKIALMNTQQYMDEEQIVRITGDVGISGPMTMAVQPEDILGQYDFVPVDGTMPIDKYALANLWREMLASMRQMPEIGMQYDMAGIFAWIAQLAGLKNIKQFRINPMDMGALQNGVQQGNLIPIPGRRGGRPQPGGGGGDPARVPEPGQISGMGSTG